VPGWAKTVAVVLVLVFVFAAFVSIANPGTVFDGWNTTGETWQKRGWDFKVNFDTINVIGSWKDGFQTETFTITGAIAYKSITGANPLQYRYSLYIPGTDTPIQQTAWTGVGGALIADYAWHYMAPYTTSIPTSGKVSLLVVMEVKIFDYLQTFTYSDPSDLAWDGAQVFSGAGAIELHSSTPSPREEGDTASFYIETGYTGGVGWDVMVQPPALRTDLDQSPRIIKHLGDNIFGGTIVSWTVPAGAFKESTNPLMNEWKALLVNQYFVQSWTSVFSIDQYERMPLITDVKATLMDTGVTYVVTCEETYAPLGGVLVNAWYSYGGTTKPGPTDTQSWLIRDLHVPISGNTATFSVSGGNTKGTIMVEIIAYDTGGRTSLIDYDAFEWDGIAPVIIPPPYEQGFIWTTTAIIIAVIGSLACVALFIIPPFWPIAPWKIIGAIIIAILTALLCYLAGTLQLPYVTGAVIAYAEYLSATWGV
jgi:hypothetical protein